MNQANDIPPGLRQPSGGSAALPVTDPQRTLAHAISCVGVGRHFGARVGLTLHPAPADSGIRFRRTDRAGSAAIAARPENLVVSDHALVLGDGDGMRIVGIEQVMAALVMTGIDNALIELGGPELPAMDGSARPFVFLIECAGAVSEATPRRLWPAPAPVELRRGAAIARLAPSPTPCLRATLAAPSAEESRPEAAATLTHAVALERDALRQDLAGARQPLTEAEWLAAQERGLMRGVSLENTLLLTPAGPANPGGLRHFDEAARHANLLALGALALLGGLPPVEVETRGAGHALLARLLRHCQVSPHASPAEPATTGERRLGLAERAHESPLGSIRM